MCFITSKILLESKGKDFDCSFLTFQFLSFLYEIAFLFLFLHLQISIFSFIFQCALVFLFLFLCLVLPNLTLFFLF